MREPYRILIVGGYGVFGGRLARLLADEPRLTLIIAGRSRDKAKAFAAGLAAKATLETAVFDRGAHGAKALGALNPDLVVDASGPFQAYGEKPYRLIETCIEACVPYMDLADGADFVDGVARFDAAAQARDVYVLSGVSSFPVLTAAVVRALSGGMETIESIEGGIAPSPYAGVGENVIRAIASYAGKPVVLQRDGRASQGAGLVETRWFVISPPGHLPLKSTRFSLVDVPDLRVLPRLWPGVREVWMGAGPVPEILHRMLNGLAKLVSMGLLPSLSGLAGLFYRAINVVRWGEHRGGMYVRVRGRSGGVAVERSWHLLAEGDDGPFIPSMAVEALVRRILAGSLPAVGARAAVAELELEDYAAVFAGKTIYSGVREKSPVTAGLPLYRRVLGRAYRQLTPAVAALHDVTEDAVFSGRATVERGWNPLAMIVGALMGFPKAGVDVPVRVDFEVDPDKEVWRRTFGKRRFFSVQRQGQGRWAGLITEQFGPVVVGLAPVIDGPRLLLIPRRWSVFGVVLPLWLAPSGPAFEAEGDLGAFRFHVEIGHPLTGLIVRYQGWLKPGAPMPSSRN